MKGNKNKERAIAQEMERQGHRLVLRDRSWELPQDLPKFLPPEGTTRERRLGWGWVIWGMEWREPAGALEVMQGPRDDLGTAVGWAEDSAWAQGGQAAGFCKMSSAGSAGD